MRSRRMMIATGLSALTVAASGGRAGLASPPQGLASADLDDWPAASPESQGIDGLALEGIFIAAKSLYALRSVVVVRNGFLVGEHYYYGQSVSRLSPINSVTKSVASMLVGIAVQQGKIRSLAQTVGELLPEAAAKAPDSAVNGLTLAQILTMTTGLPEDGRPIVHAKDPVSYVQGLPIDRTNPPVWDYSNTAVSLISPILAHAVGGSMADFAKAVLFSPLGIEEYEWPTDAVGNVWSWAGLRLRARDMAKLAWTMADAGRWGGRQIVPAQWVEDSTRPHIGVSWRVPPITHAAYGYLWFTGKMQGRTVTWAWGRGSQFALMVPSLRLVVGTLADSPPPQDLFKQNAEVMGLVSQIVELAR